MLLQSSMRPMSAPAVRPAHRVSWLPREHGSWALALEPILLALLAAPSWRGAALGLFGVMMFLIRRPWWLWRQEGACVRIVAVLATCGASAALFALAGAGAAVWVILLPGALCGGVFGWLDGRRESRSLAAELCGAACFAALAAAIVLLGGLERGLLVAGLVGGFALIRAATSILPIRLWLRRRKGRREAAWPAGLAAVLACIAGVATWLAWGAWIPLAWTAVFALRTVWIAGPWAPSWSARRLGLWETALGFAAVVTTGVSLS